ncbi:hypothetical protein BRD11_03405 [Halobacteriales archaeon SW_12_69_24]|nr:MAG: hypothetical protein BRD11_03405 [Halobacteriales archaeon SW_12_69_24]
MTEGLTHEAWTAAVRDGRLLGATCGDCGATVGTPTAACPHCGARSMESVELSTRGTVYTETTIEVPPAGISAGGYQVAVVDFGDARVLGRLDDQDVAIGDDVVLAGYVEDEQGYPAPRFEAV